MTVLSSSSQIVMTVGIASIYVSKKVKAAIPKRTFGKSTVEILQRVRREQYRAYLFSAGRRSDGTFSSFESANDFVSRTLEENKTDVDLVAEGIKDEIFITRRFGYPTGREAYMKGDTESYIRNTYSVGVFIVNDPTRARGYRIVTAYPRNGGD